MRRGITFAAASGGAVGFVAGAMFWYLASPLWIDVVVHESVSAAQADAVPAVGRFADADFVHRGRGAATVLRGGDGRTIVRFREFSVTNAPDLYVWLVAHATPSSADDVKKSAYISLGRLKGNMGDQNYDVPAGVDLAAFRSVVIWCRRFGALFSAAPLMPASA
jgi:hypothetical protein